MCAHRDYTYEEVRVVAVEEEAEAEADPALLLKEEVDAEADQERPARGAAHALDQTQPPAQE